MICEICNKEYKSIQPLSKHVTAYHQMSKQDYYDIYLKSPDEGICHEASCNNKTIFVGMDKGYNKYCCKSCQVRAQGNGKKIDHNKMWEIRRNTIKQYENEHNCIHLSNAVDTYGRILYKCIEDLKIPVIRVSRMYQYINNEYIKDIELYIDVQKQLEKERVKRKQSVKREPSVKKTKNNRRKSINKIHTKRDYTWNNPIKGKQTVLSRNAQFEIDNNCTQVGKIIDKYGQGWKSLKLPIIIRNHNAHFISNEYISIIEKYASENHRGISLKEKHLYTEIKNSCDYEVRGNDRKTIPHYELDVYIPELKLAFEFNGTKWHSIQNGMPIDYHLKKSLICKEYGIRLVHIYEFESLDTQIQLAKDLVNGIDNYNKKDFNKNNFLDVPKPEIVHGSKYYTVYGAGKLY